MRFTANPITGTGVSIAGRVNPGGYAPAPTDHNLAVLRTFYADRIDAGVVQGLPPDMRRINWRSVSTELMIPQWQRGAGVALSGHFSS